MKRPFVVSAVIVLAAFALIQLVPVDRSNPSVVAGLDAPPEVTTVLRASCYDCHSNETRWPWYSRIAPASWLVAHDVEEGRSRLNFSLWGTYEEGRRQRLAEEVREEVEKGEMPPALYLLAHPEARLSADDLGLLREWSALSSGER